MQQAIGSFFSRYVPQCACSSCVTEELKIDPDVCLSEAALPDDARLECAAQNPILLSSGKRDNDLPPLKRNWLPAEETSGSDIMSERNADASKLQWTVVSQSTLGKARVEDERRYINKSRICSDDGQFQDKGQFGPNSNHRCNSHDACRGVSDASSTDHSHVRSHHHSHNDSNLDVSPSAISGSATMVIIPSLAHTAPSSPPLNHGLPEMSQTETPQTEVLATPSSWAVKRGGATHATLLASPSPSPSPSSLDEERAASVPPRSLAADSLPVVSTTAAAATTTTTAVRTPPRTATTTTGADATAATTPWRPLAMSISFDETATTATRLESPTATGIVFPTFEDDMRQGRRCEYVSEVTARRAGATYRVSRSSGQFLLVLDEEFGGTAVGCPISSICDVYCSEDGPEGFSKLVWNSLSGDDFERVAAIVFAAPDDSFCRVCLLDETAAGRRALLNLLRSIRFGVPTTSNPTTGQVLLGDTNAVSQPNSESDFEGFAADF